MVADVRTVVHLHKVNHASAVPGQHDGHMLIALGQLCVYSIGSATYFVGNCKTIDDDLIAAGSGNTDGDSLGVGIKIDTDTGGAATTITELCGSFFKAIHLARCKPGVDLFLFLLTSYQNLSFLTKNTHLLRFFAYISMIF